MISDHRHHQHPHGHHDNNDDDDEVDDSTGSDVSDETLFRRKRSDEQDKSPNPSSVFLKRNRRRYQRDTRANYNCECLLWIL